MSTVMDNVAGKGRNVGTNVWIFALIASLVVFAGNTVIATTKAARLGGASTAASNLQVNSQKLANQGREAIGGKAESFADFKATRAEGSAAWTDPSMRVPNRVRIVVSGARGRQAACRHGA